MRFSIWSCGSCTSMRSICALVIPSQSIFGMAMMAGITGERTTTRNATSQVGRSAMERNVLPGATMTPMRRPNDEFSMLPPSRVAGGSRTQRRRADPDDQGGAFRSRMCLTYNLPRRQGQPPAAERRLFVADRRRALRRRADRPAEAVEVLYAQRVVQFHAFLVEQLADRAVVLGQRAA